MSIDELPDWMPQHIVVNDGGPESYNLECRVCTMGMKSGQTFGPIDGATIAAMFIVQHAVHTAKGDPAGLTPKGDVSAAFRAYLAGARAVLAKRADS
jgi:hypothetical protein